MATRKLTFLINKMTPGTMRLQEDAPQGEEVIGPLYVKNWAWQEDQTEGGEVIGYEVTIEPIHATKKMAAPRKATGYVGKAKASIKSAPAKTAAPARKAPAKRPASVK